MFVRNIRNPTKANRRRWLTTICGGLPSCLASRMALSFSLEESMCMTGTQEDMDRL
ncbi:MAG: hypothetical protein HDR09_14355 [Lachnospiraceae bacterium]|nr:hypothetical protein [Lachnospiraceae bacterium]